MLQEGGGVGWVGVLEEKGGRREGSGRLASTVTARLGGSEAVGRARDAHGLRPAGVGVVYVSIAYLAVELVRTDVGLDQVVRPPLDGILEVAHLAGCLIRGAIVDPSIGQDGHRTGHRVAKLDIVSGWGQTVITH